jgi:transcriptional regulator with XRE-family HTH domain
MTAGMTSPAVAAHFGLLLTRRRLRARLRQAELAYLLGVHRPEISEYERGARSPRLDSLLQLAAGVEAEPRDLLIGMRWVPGASVIGGDYEIAAQRRGEASNVRL